MNEERGKVAFALHQKIVANEEMRRNLMNENARYLSEIFDNKLYKELLGDEEAEWAGYLSNIEVWYTRNKVITLIHVYNKLTKKLDIPEEVWGQAPLSRLAEVLKYITKENYEEWISNALVLTTRDWNIILRKVKGQITEETSHDCDMVEYVICRRCGKRIRKEKYHEHEDE